MAARLLGIVGLVALLAACATTPPPPPPAVLVACDVVPGELWAAGDLPDGLPADPADAVLTLYRAWSEARAALATVRSVVEHRELGR